MTLRTPLVLDTEKSLAAELQSGDLLDFSKVDNSPFADYIDGLKMVWVSGTALTVTTGAAYIPGISKVLRVSSDITKAGLSLTASTWYHVYLYDNAGTPDVEIVTTAPAAAYSGTARAKTGDTSKRYAGSVKTNSSSSIYCFTHFQGLVIYEEDGVSGTPFNNFLFNGVASTSTTVSASAVAPLTAKGIMLRANNTASSPVNLGVPGDNASGRVSNVAATTNAFFNWPVNSSQQMSYFYASTPASGLYLGAIGYFYER